MKKYLITILFAFILLLIGKESKAQSVQLAADSIELTCGQSGMVEVPIRVSNFNDIGSFEFSIKWDTDYLSYVDTSGLSAAFQALNTQQNPVFSGFNISEVGNGFLSFSWLRLGGHTFPNNDVEVFSVRFDYNGSGPSDIEFVNTPTSVNFTDSNSSAVPFTLKSGFVGAIDSDMPTIACPSDIVVAMATGAQVLSSPIPPSGVTDNCGIQDTSYTLTGATQGVFGGDASTQVFQPGQTFVEYTVTDLGNNTAACSFSVSLQVADDTLSIYTQSAASVDCGNPYFVDVKSTNFDTLGSLEFSVNWPSGFLRYDSVGLFHPLLGLSTSANFNEQDAQLSTIGGLGFSWVDLSSLVGTNIPSGETLFRIYYSVIGAAGNNPDIEFGDAPTVREAYRQMPYMEAPIRFSGGTVAITDMENPTITCPPSVMTQPDPASVHATVIGLTPTVGDNCGLSGYSYSIENNGQISTGSFDADGSYQPGISTVTYTVEDDNGNTNTCDFTVNVSMIDAVELNFDSLFLSCNHNDTAKVCVKVKNFADAASAQFTVRWDPDVLDYLFYSDVQAGFTAPPGLFFAPSNMPGELNFIGSNSNGWPDLMDGETFICFNFLIKKDTITSVAIFDSTGTEYIVADSGGNRIAATTSGGLVNAADEVAPSYPVCSSDIMVTAPAGLCSADVQWPAIHPVDDCGLVDSTMTHSAMGGTFNVGVTEVLFTATDVGGNTGECRFNVMVEDNTPPVFSNCPMDLTVDLTTGCTAAGNWTAPLVTDACQLTVGDPTVNIAPDSLLPVGNYTVAYVATDTSGNGNTCSFNVTVQDTVAPEFTNCPMDINIVLAATDCSAAGAWTPPTLMDACLLATGGIMTNIAPDSVLQAGAYSVNYLGTDAAGNTAVCNFSVIVQDTVAPEFTNCPTDINIVLAATDCSAAGDWTAPTLTDACVPASGGVTTNITPDSLLLAGTYTVQYDGMDVGGNPAAPCTFSVTVQDTVAPEFTNCPMDINIVLAAADCSAAGTWTVPTLTGACTAATVTTNIAVDSLLGLGTYTVQYDGIDGSTMAVPCTFSVTVQDTVAPVFTSCPVDTVSMDNPFVYNFAPPTATDNCGTPTMTLSHLSGTSFANDTMVVAIATDASGNIDSCVFTVTIGGNCVSNPMIINCPSDSIYEDVGCTVAVTYAAPEITGFCSTNTTSSISIINSNLQSFNNGDALPVGVYDVLITVNGDMNETATCPAVTIDISETEAPVLNCPASVTVDLAGNIISDVDGFVSASDPLMDCTGSVISFLMPSASDNCDTNPLTSQTGGILPGATFNQGVSFFEFLAIDDSGNSSTCSVSISMVEVETFTISTASTEVCPGNAVTLDAPMYPNATYTWSGPGGGFANSNSITIDPFTMANVGTYDLSINTNGCEVMSDDMLSISLVEAPIAILDLFSVVENETLDTFNVVLNDSLIPANYTVSMINPANGVTNLGQGQFSFEGSQIATNITFDYALCSTVCPSLCDTATVGISVKNTRCDFFPNVITPNDDGINDEFLIPCLEFGDYPDNSLKIYNQWGDVVFEAAPCVFDKALAFKGLKDNVAGEVLPDGVYYYIFRTADGDAPYKGFIQLFR